MIEIDVDDWKRRLDRLADGYDFGQDWAHPGFTETLADATGSSPVTELRALLHELGVGRVPRSRPEIVTLLAATWINLPPEARAYAPASGSERRDGAELVAELALALAQGRGEGSEARQVTRLREAVAWLEEVTPGAGG